jgi:predicted ATP-grasp superfamily ATP-dependent carboligase
MAYAGWGDGGEAATTAIKYLLRKLDAEPIATLDTEEFLDFTVVRPYVRRRRGEREIRWPDHEIFAVELPDRDSDLVLGLGIEPHLRWKAYARALRELARALEVELAILLGAYVGDVIYSQPIEIAGAASDPALGDALGIEPSAYEGPTGITGVLTDVLGRAGIRTASLWAALPHYISLSPNPRGSMALLKRVERATGLEFDYTGMLESVGHFDTSVTEMVKSDPELSAYVRELKRRAFSG